MLLTSNSTVTFSRNETSLGQNNCSNFFVDSTAERISKLFAYCFILLGSFLGNIAIIIIVYRYRYLRTTVNYFIVNMAVSDLLYPLSVIPAEITKLITNSWHWQVSGILASVFCTSHHFLRDFSLHVSTQSLVWIAVDRFIAVVFPIKVGLISTKIRTIAISSTWIFAGVLNIPLLLTSKLVECGNNTFCLVRYKVGPVFPNQEAIAAYTWLHVTFASITPLFLITILYSVIAVSLKIQNKAPRGHHTKSATTFPKETKTSYSNGCRYRSFVLHLCYSSNASIFCIPLKTFLCSFKTTYILYWDVCPVFVFCCQSNDLLVICGKLPLWIEKHFVFLLQKAEQ